MTGTEKLALAAVVLLALVESTAALRAPSTVARADEWAAAAAEVRAELRPGDLIVFAPAWVDPIGRAQLGDLMPLEMVGRADNDRYGRAWELSIRGAVDPSVQGRILKETAHGHVRVRLYERAQPAQVTYDFTARADEARVTQTPANAGAETPCYRDGVATFRCATTKVERRTLEVDYHPRRGLLVPVDGTRTTALTFDGVGIGTALTGYTGLSDYYSRKSADGPVRFRVLIDGVERLAVEHLNSDGWRRFHLPMPPAPDGAATPLHQVRFEISAPNAAWRTFGFHAEARR